MGFPENNFGGIWIKRKVGSETYFLCSTCGTEHDQLYDNCNGCGAYMRGFNDMDAAQMRIALKERTKYANSYKWHKKVNAMSDRQVMAVYFKMVRGGELK